MEWVGFNVSDLSVTGVILLILAAFAVFTMLKGLVRSLFALTTLGVSGFAAWWGYNYGHSWLSQYSSSLPEHTHIIVAAFSGVGVFYLFSKIFDFILNPFEGEKKDNASKWIVGVPAILMSLVAALIFICVAMNRLRTTDAMDQIKYAMENGLENVEQRNGFHPQVMKKLNESVIGEFMLTYDPVWEQNRVKLALLLIHFYQYPHAGEQIKGEGLQLIQDADFQKQVLSNLEVTQAMKNRDPSKLWEAQVLDVAVKHGKWSNLLTRLDMANL